jgi:hypothetical protein
LAADTKTSTNEELNTYCSLRGQAKNHVLLATAIVEVFVSAAKLFFVMN